LKGTGSSAYSEIEGQTTILLLMPEGKRVKKGDLVAELDSSSLRDNLTNQEITLTRAGADHAKAQKTRQIAELSIQEYLDGSFKQRQAELEAEIFIAKARQNRLLEGIKRTRVALDRLKSISENKPETDSASILATLDLEERIAESELEIERAKLDTEQAGRKLDLFLKTTHTKTIAQLEVGLEQAKSDELAKRASYELERTKFEKLRRQIVKCKLLAWEDGMIVYANDAKQPGQPMIEEGATVRERQAIFSIFNPGRMQVVAKVREAWVDRLVPDQKVSIHVDAVPNERLEGRVRTISPVPDSATGGIKFHTTIIDIDAPPRMLRPGMTAESNILIDRLDDVIAVPLSAVKQVGNSHYVLIKRDDGKFEWRSVQPGRASSTEVEIKQGLSAGEHVVRDFDALTQSEQLRVGPFPYQR
jgi:RND family efflux transporter MFP subunit